MLAQLGGGLLAFITVMSLICGVGWLMWTETDGYQERIRHRKAMNDIERKKAKRAAEIELKTLEWQSTATLEDLTEHRLRLKGQLDDLHRAQEEGDRHA